MSFAMSSAKVLVATVAVAFALLLLAPSASAIQCYQCNSAKDPHCADVKQNVSAAHMHLRECRDPNMPEKAKPFCRKIVQTILNKKERRVIRKCGYEQSPKPCYHFDDDDHNEIVCQCFEEACNSAPISSGSVITATAMSAFIMVLAR